MIATLIFLAFNLVLSQSQDQVIRSVRSLCTDWSNFSQSNEANLRQIQSDFPGVPGLVYTISSWCTQVMSSNQNQQGGNQQGGNQQGGNQQGGNQQGGNQQGGNQQSGNQRRQETSGMNLDFPPQPVLGQPMSLPQSQIGSRWEGQQMGLPPSQIGSRWEGQQMGLPQSQIGSRWEGQQMGLPWNQMSSRWEGQHMGQGYGSPLEHMGHQQFAPTMGPISQQMGQGFGLPLEQMGLPLGQMGSRFEGQQMGQHMFPPIGQQMGQQMGQGIGQGSMGNFIPNQEFYGFSGFPQQFSGGDLWNRMPYSSEQNSGKT